MFDWWYSAVAHSQLILTLFDKADRVVPCGWWWWVRGGMGVCFAHRFHLKTLNSGNQIGSKAGTTARPRAER